MGWYSSVASLPAYLSIILGPPGCSEVESQPIEQAEARESWLCTGQEIGDIVHSSVHNHPTRLSRIMLRDFLAAELDALLLL